MAESGGSKPKLLVVDDDPAIRDFLRWVLRADYDVTECPGVVEALTAIERRAPDVVVTDLDLDDGCGKHLLVALADRFPSVQRLVFSAAPTGDLVHLVRSGLAHAAVSKTQQLVVLVSELERLVREKEQGDATNESPSGLRRSFDA